MRKVCFTNQWLNSSVNYMKTFETEIISGTKNIHELEIYKTNTSLPCLQS